MLPVPDRRLALGGLKDSASRFTALLRGVDDHTRTAIGYWTIGDTATHVAHISEVMLELARGGTSPITDHRKISESWEVALDDDPERDPAAAAARIEKAVSAFTDLAPAEAWEEVKNWHGDLRMPVYTLASILVTEFEIHGLDIATAMERGWKIAPHNALVSIQGLLPLLPHFVDEQAAAGFTATYKLDLRGGPPVFVRVADSALAISLDPPEKVDCTIKADPLSYLLIGYGRKGQWGPIATGKVMALGRKPWLALKFSKLLRVP